MVKLKKDALIWAALSRFCSAFIQVLRRKDVQEDVSSRGFNARAILQDAHAVRDIRNDAVHFREIDQHGLDRLRDELFRPDGMLARLHPGSGPKA